MAEKQVLARVPPELLRRGRVIRPQDAGGVYAYPRPEFDRLARAGALHRLAPGLFAVVPDDHVGRPWLPDLEAVALGVAATGGNVDSAALMGVSAARVHGAVPRALGVAVVAVERHRTRLRLVDRDAEVLFVRREVSRLDVQRHRSELGQGWVTTVEQTLLDLAARPLLGSVPDAVAEAIPALLARADRELLHELARTQRRVAALARVVSGAR